MSEEERLERIRAVRGKYAYLGLSSDDLAREKRQEERAPREEPEHPTTKAGEWIAEALADVAEVIAEPVMVSGLVELTREVGRVADNLEGIRALLEELLDKKEG